MELEASIVVPVHNEAALLRRNTEILKEYLTREVPNNEIILCENGSSDGTAEIAEELSKSGSVAFLRLTEASLAEALKEGFKAARSDKVIYYPIDLSVDLGFIPESISLLDVFDVVIGSKRLAADSDRRPLSRRISSRGYHGLVRRFFGVEFSDTTCVKAYRRDRILGIMDRIPASSRIFETELLVEALKEGFEIVEVPVRVEEHRRSREGLGKKIQGKLEDLLSARLDLIAIYAGATLFLIGVGGLIYLTMDKLLFASKEGFVNPYSFLLSMLLVISGFQIATFGLLANLMLQIRRELTRTSSSEAKKDAKNPKSI